MKRYTKETAVQKLIKNRVKIEGVLIEFKTCGIGCLGAIDYLCKEHGFSWKRV